MSPKKQEPTNREAFTQIIGPPTYVNFPTRPICCRSRRRCAQTARISLLFHQFQRARTQNKQHTRTSGVSAVSSPEFRHRRLNPLPASQPPHRCAASSSVRQLLGNQQITRKTKNATTSLFLCNTLPPHNILRLQRLRAQDQQKLPTTRHHLAYAKRFWPGFPPPYCQQCNDCGQIQAGL